MSLATSPLPTIIPRYLERRIARWWRNWHYDVLTRLRERREPDLDLALIMAQQIYRERVIRLWREGVPCQRIRQNSHLDDPLMTEDEFRDRLATHLAYSAGQKRSLRAAKLRRLSREVANMNRSLVEENHSANHERESSQPASLRSGTKATLSQRLQEANRK